jgi:hypothetical protein
LAARALVAAAATVASAPCVLAGADAALTLGHASRTIELSLDDLAALPQTTVVTENEFSDGKVAYRGPLVRDVLARLGLDQAPEVRFTAVNDYFVDIPTSDFEQYDAILAMEADGKPLSRREKGPLWLMYPISDHKELLDPVYLRRLIWQVVRIDPL